MSGRDEASNQLDDFKKANGVSVVQRDECFLITAWCWDVTASHSSSVTSSLCYKTFFWGNLDFPKMNNIWSLNLHKNVKTKLISAKLY